jgi:predicted RNA polymerase sigma factor
MRNDPRGECREARVQPNRRCRSCRPDAQEHDDTLTLFFGCCHPSLSPSSAIALTLRAVGGLTTGEIARAFMVPEATMAQRISRAKQTIKASGVPFGQPDEGDRAARLDAVLHVVYLIFSEGYASSSGAAVHRIELEDEAIRLARMLQAQLPHDAEVRGLLALMLLTDARRNARTGPDGELISLEEQDRTRWNRNRIEEGSALWAPSRGPPVPTNSGGDRCHDEAARGRDGLAQIAALF